jgi:hypothetical protein
MEAAVVREFAVGIQLGTGRPTALGSAEALKLRPAVGGRQRQAGQKHHRRPYIKSHE